MTFETLKMQLGDVVYNRTAVVKADCPFAMTIAQSVTPQSWRMVAYFEDDFMVIVIPRKTKPEVYLNILENMYSMTSDWQLL